MLVSVAMSALAQITLKYGMSSSRVANVLIQDDRAATLLTIATQPQIIGGLALYGAGAVLWLFVLAKIDVSVAYPFVGLGFILTMLLGVILLGEQVTMLRVVGTLMVFAGVILVARS